MYTSSDKTQKENGECQHGGENVKISEKVNIGRGILAPWLSELLSKDMYYFCYIHIEY